jgi:hypothetical protein
VPFKLTSGPCPARHPIPAGPFLLAFLDFPRQNQTVDPKTSTVFHGESVMAKSKSPTKEKKKAKKTARKAKAK